MYTLVWRVKWYLLHQCSPWFLIFCCTFLLHFHTKIFCQGFNVDKKELESGGEPGLHAVVLPWAIFSVWRAVAFCFWSSIVSSKFTSTAGILCLHTDPKILRSLSRHTLLEYFIQLHCCNRFLATESWVSCFLDIRQNQNRLLTDKYLKCRLCILIQLFKTTKQITAYFQLPHMIMKSLALRPQKIVSLSGY